MCAGDGEGVDEYGGIDVLHDSNNSRFDGEATGVVVLLLGFLALFVAFDLVASADDADLDLDELTLEVLVERETIAGVDVAAHRLFDQEPRFGRHSKRLKVASQVTWC